MLGANGKVFLMSKNDFKDSVAVPPSFADEVTGSAEGGLRLTLLEAALARKFSDAEYTRFLGQLAAAYPDRALAADIAVAQTATYDQAPQLVFDTVSGQLLWAATLLHLAMTAAQDGKRFSETKFSHHLTNHPVFQQELLRYAYALSDHFDRNQTRIRIGEPLSWFYFSPDEQAVNLDPFHMLVFGLPRHPLDHAHSRAAAFHEVAHAILSTRLPPSFQKVLDRLKQRGDKTEPTTDNEKQEAVDQRIEAMLWGQFYNLAEDNVANRFPIILGRYRQAQPADYAESLKNIYALIGRSRKNFEDFKTDQWSNYVKKGRDFLEKFKSVGAVEQFNAVTTVLGLSVPVNEGLFPSTKGNWEKAGLHWQAFMPSLDDAAKLQAVGDILAEGDGGPHSISYQQPYVYRAGLDGNSGNKMDGFRRALRHLVADNTTIHAPEEVEKANKARNDVIEGLWQKYVAPLLPQIKAEIRQQMEQQAAQGQQQDKGDQLPSPPSSGLGSNQQKQDQKADQQSEQGEGQSAATGNGEKDAATGKQDKDKANPQRGDESGALIQDIIDGAKSQEAQEAKRRSEQQDQLESSVRQAQHAAQTIKYDFPEGDWGNYQSAKQKLAWLIRVFARQLEDIRKKQVERHISRGRQLEVLPDGGEIDRLDLEAQFRLVSRHEAYVPVREDDYRRFAGNKTVIKHATPQLVLLIDGSGSMKQRMDGTGGGLADRYCREHRPGAL